MDAFISHEMLEILPKPQSVRLPAVKKGTRNIIVSLSLLNLIVKFQQIGSRAIHPQENRKSMASVMESRMEKNTTNRTEEIKVKRGEVLKKKM